MAETFQDLVARGLEPTDIARLVRTKQLTRIRRGIYLRGTDLTPEQRHRELIAATVPELAKGSVLSHVSAAVLHELPVPVTSLVRVHSTRPEASGRISRYAHRHGAALPSECVTVIDDFSVTAVERTVADLCRFLPYADAVAVVDAALRKGVAATALTEQLQMGHHRPNNDRFRRALAFGDGRAESPGKSRSRVLMAQLICQHRRSRGSSETILARLTRVPTSIGRTMALSVSSMGNRSTAGWSNPARHSSR